MEQTGRGIRLRPLGLGDLFDETFRIYRRHFQAFVLAFALAIVPGTLIMLVVSLVVGLGASRAQSDLTMLLAGGLATIPGALLVGFGYLLAWAAVIQLTSAAILGEPVAVRAAYRVVLRRLLPLLWTGFQAGVFEIVMVISVIGIPPAIYFGLGWTLVGQTCVLESLSGRAAMRRSASLLRSNRWRCLGITVLSWLLLSVLVSLPTGLLNGVAAVLVPVLKLGTAGMVMVQGVNAVVSTLGEAIFGSISHILLTLLYYDLRVRKEAFDLEQRVEAAGTVPLAVPPA